MKIIYTGIHKSWGITEHGNSPDEIAKKIGAEAADMSFTSMSEEEHILQEVPEEFRATLAYMAYERGHSAGDEEILMLLRELVSNLLPAIKAFEEKLARKGFKETKEL